MKNLYLICNAHIDPVWLWDWDEGMATAVSTFYSAAELAAEYQFIFCHNEAALYEFIEKNDPALFSKIRALVRQGKWRIAGGWYIQPDCNLPCGESFVRQIWLGKKYFREKFGAESEIAFNVDSFGHSVGLPQILRKTGYTGYIVCRPDAWGSKPGVFLWKGPDGSAVKVAKLNTEGLYSTPEGKFFELLPDKCKPFAEEECGMILWGVGNHGGGPSRRDLDDIEAFNAQKDKPFALVHSAPEEAMRAVGAHGTIERSLRPSFMKCYSSMSSVKQRHAELEDKLYFTEKICAFAAMSGADTYDFAKFTEAEKDLCRTEFHDILAGTAAENGEKTALQWASHGLCLLNEMLLQSFMRVVNGCEPSPQGLYPVFVFNPLPYAHRAVIETEFLRSPALTPAAKRYRAKISGREGARCQIIKELANINDGRRNRILIEADLQGFGVHRFDVALEPAPETAEEGGDGAKGILSARFSQGALCSLVYGGEELLTGKILPEWAEDNADPWGWDLPRTGAEKHPLDPCGNMDGGIFAGLPAFHRTESGDVADVYESFYRKDLSLVRLNCRVYKNLPFIDIEADVLWNDKTKALFLAFPLAGEGTFYGQTAYATEQLGTDVEQTAQRFVYRKLDEKRCIALLNTGIYGYAVENGALHAVLLNGSAYCAHYLEGIPLIDESRYIPGIEEGRRKFRMRLGVFDTETLENEAIRFAQGYYALNHFPHGKKSAPCKTIRAENPAVAMTVCKASENGGYILRLFNNNGEENGTQLTVEEAELYLAFAPYEIKTVRYENGRLTPVGNLEI